MTNDKLPEEMQEQIESEADVATKEFIKEFNIPHREGYYTRGHIDGATAWAPWKVKYNEAKKLLDEVFRKHESGLLPDRFIYEKIKTFLNGE